MRKVIAGFIHSVNSEVLFIFHRFDHALRSVQKRKNYICGKLTIKTNKI